jgi:hypothetical protein
VFLGSEERQPLVIEDIPLPFGLPAVELKWAERQAPRLQAAYDRVRAVGITRRANPE